MLAVVLMCYMKAAGLVAIGAIILAICFAGLDWFVSTRYELTKYSTLRRLIVRVGAVLNILVFAFFVLLLINAVAQELCKGQ